mmetsp:Transcript_620/g.2285  ORF Transcript_620/g.2285 Transcript_620/m.2285 type:complete len:224 (-) Transcript_620:22-693(-)
MTTGRRAWAEPCGTPLTPGADTQSPNSSTRAPDVVKSYEGWNSHLHPAEVHHRVPLPRPVLLPYLVHSLDREHARHAAETEVEEQERRDPPGVRHRVRRRLVSHADCGAHVNEDGEANDQVDRVVREEPEHEVLVLRHHPRETAQGEYVYHDAVHEYPIHRCRRHEAATPFVDDRLIRSVGHLFRRRRLARVAEVASLVALVYEQDYQPDDELKGRHQQDSTT